MARYEVTGPDGGKFEVTAPEGASETQVLTYARTQFERMQNLKEPEFEREAKKTLSYTPAELIAGSAPARFALGAAAPIMGAAQLGAEALGDKTGTETLKRIEELKRRGMEAYGQEGTDWIGLGGTVMSAPALKLMKLAPAATVLGRAAQGAAVGAGFGAATPVPESEDYATVKATQIGTGAAIGALIPVTIDGVRYLWDTAKRVLQPLLPGGTERAASRVLAQAADAGGKRAEIERLLAENKQFVSGSQPTAAEAAAPAGSAEFSALERLSKGIKPTAYEDIAKAQDAARLAAVRAVGQDKPALQAAEASRKAVSDPLYAAAREGTKPVNTAPVTAKVDLILKNNPGNRELVTELTNIKKGLEAAGSDPQKVASVLDGMKASIKDEKNKFIGGVLNKLKEDLVDAIPGYKKAQAVFAVKSDPVNRMEIGQYLEQKLTNPLDETATQRAASYAGALRDAPGTIKRATGAPRFDELEKVPGMSQQNLSDIKGVLSDLARKARAEKLGKLGMQRGAQIEQPFGLPATGPLHQQYMIFKTVLGRISKGLNDKTIDMIADALQVPSKTLKLLQNAPSAQQQKIVDNIITAKIGRGAVIAATTGSSEAAQQ